MKLNEIFDGEESAELILKGLIKKKELSNTDRAKATGLLAKVKASRRNPKPGQEPVCGSHINDPFAGDTGSAGDTTVGPISTGANRY